ncbi:hypothetical protein D3C71_21010 [compost metagenome]
MLKHLLAAVPFAACLLAGPALAATSPAAAPSPFPFLKVGDVSQTDCGTYLVDPGQEPGLQNMRLFMTTERVLHLRTGKELRTLELDRVEQKMRDQDVLGRGDQVDLFFLGKGKEAAAIFGTVTQAVVDDDGSYPIIELDADVSYTSPSGKTVRQRLAAHDMCL